MHESTPLGSESEDVCNLHLSGQMNFLADEEHRATRSATNQELEGPGRSKPQGTDPTS